MRLYPKDLIWYTSGFVCNFKKDRENECYIWIEWADVDTEKMFIKAWDYAR